MRRLLLFLIALALSGCSILPALLSGDPGPAAPSPELAAALARGANDSASVTLGTAPQRILVAAGERTAYLSAIVITGASLRYNDARCATTGRAEVTCTYNLLEIPAGRRFGQSVGGTDLHATTLYRRAKDGPLFAKPLRAAPLTPPSAEPCPGC